MNRISFYLIATALSTQLPAQETTPLAKITGLPSYPLEVTYNKTTQILFPERVISVDRGTEAILVEKAGGADNILRIKAGVKGFEETSLSVVTEGHLYSFLVRYTESPSFLNLKLTHEGATDAAEVAGVIQHRSFTRPQLMAIADKLAAMRRTVHGVKDRHDKMNLRLDGLYVKQDYLFFMLRMANQSCIDYAVDQFRFYIRDKKQARRTASQEKELEPQFLWGDTSLIRGNQAQMVIAALPLFTIPDKNYLAIEVTEMNGGRNLLLKIRKGRLVRASPIDGQHDQVP